MMEFQSPNIIFKKDLYQLSTLNIKVEEIKCTYIIHIYNICQLQIHISTMYIERRGRVLLDKISTLHCIYLLSL